MSTINRNTIFSRMSDRAQKRMSPSNVADVLAALDASVLRYRVTVDLDGDRLTYWCESAGEAGGLREAFEKVNGASCNVIVWDELQERRIY